MKCSNCGKPYYGNGFCGFCGNGIWVENRLQRESALNPVRMKIYIKMINSLQESLINIDRNGLRYSIVRNIKKN